MRVKIEIRGGKKYIVARDKGGRIDQIKKYSRDEPIAVTRKRYHDTGSINDKETRKRLKWYKGEFVGKSKIVEVDQNFISALRSPPERPYRVAIIAEFDKKTYPAASKTRKWGNLNAARAEARDNLIRIINKDLFEAYDDNEDIIDEIGNIDIIEERVIYYVHSRQAYADEAKAIA